MSKSIKYCCFCGHELNSVIGLDCPLCKRKRVDIDLTINRLGIYSKNEGIDLRKEYNEYMRLRELNA